MKQFIIYLFLMVSMFSFSQEKDNNLPDGNKNYAAKNFVDAEAEYRISASRFPNKAISSYNLGNAIYESKQPAESGLAYAKAIINAKERPEKHKAFHNLGNVCMKQKDYTNAVQAYRNALINNPADEESRYNYALAKKMLKENPPKKDDKKDKKKDDKKDKNKDKKDDKKDGGKDKDKDDKDKKDDKKDGDKKPQNDQPKPQEGGISKQRLENLLDAVNNEEKKVQDKVNKNKVKGKPVQTEKDW